MVLLLLYIPNYCFCFPAFKRYNNRYVNLKSTLQWQTLIQLSSVLKAKTFALGMLYH